MLSAVLARCGERGQAFGGGVSLEHRITNSTTSNLQFYEAYRFLSVYHKTQQASSCSLLCIAAGAVARFAEASQGHPRTDDESPGEATLRVTAGSSFTRGH